MPRTWSQHLRRAARGLEAAAVAAPEHRNAGRWQRLAADARQMARLWLDAPGLCILHDVVRFHYDQAVAQLPPKCPVTLELKRAAYWSFRAQHDGCGYAVAPVGWRAYR